MLSALPLRQPRHTAPSLALPWMPFLATAVVLGAALVAMLPFLPWWLRILLPALVALRVIGRRRGAARTSTLVRIMLLLGSVTGVIVEYGNIFGRDAGCALLAAMLTLKLLETDTRRDARVLVIGTAFLVMGGFLFDQGIVRTLTAFVFALVALAALYELVPGPPAKDDTVRTWMPFSAAGLRWGIKLGCYAVPFALACFLFFPRFSAGALWGTPQPGLSSRTGMSEEMQPGRSSDVYLDDTPVFRVSFDGPIPPAEDRYWRVFVFWRFTGTTWSGRTLLDGFNQGPVLEDASAPAGYEVVLEPTDDRWLPVLDAPADVPGDARLTGDFQVLRRERVTNVVRYRATSFSTYRMQPELPSRQRLLATFRFEGNPRTNELGRRLRAETGGNARAIAERALLLFNREFTYSLDVPLAGNDPVDEFLFETKIGYCEHFSSAFTALMRAADVPARVVVGYQGGFHNAIGNYLLVRRADAHAWSEIWLDGDGWVRYDPTAAVAPERIRSGGDASLGGGFGLFEFGFFANLRQRWDVLGHWWTRAVIEFNSLRQRDLVDRTGLERLGAMALVVLLTGTALIALAVAGAAGFRPRRAARDPVLFAWRALCRGMQRSGFERRRNEGPMDFAARAADAFPQHADAIRAVSRDFVALRYAESGAEPAAVQAFSVAARRLRSTLRRQRVRRTEPVARPDG